MTISVAEAKSVASREEQTADGALPENSTPDEGSLGNYVVTSEDIDDAQEEDLSMRDPKSLTAFERKILQWQTSPFAVGRVSASWKDDQYNWCRPGGTEQYDRNSKVCCSAHVCGFIGAKRVGNLAVLAQTTEEYDHIEIINEDTGEHRKSRRKRPKLLWVLGPYWHFNFFLTYPLIIGISLLTGLRSLADSSLAVIVSWSVCTFLMIFSLIMAGCRDPGVLYRHPHPPPNTQGWTWNDQAKTYRPPSARFDPECQAVIEGFDHTCPWVGTAIGSRNMFWFRLFVCMIPVCMVYAVLINIYGL